jgi:hypothetical protein
MRVYLQTPLAAATDAQRAPRFCHLIVQEDMLEGWTLIKETGYQGSKGRVTRSQFDKQDEAITALIRERDRQINNGYKVVFVEGQTLTE